MRLKEDEGPGQDELLSKIRESLRLSSKKLRAELKGRQGA